MNINNSLNVGQAFDQKSESVSDQGKLRGRAFTVEPKKTSTGTMKSTKSSVIDDIQKDIKTSARLIAVQTVKRELPPLPQSTKLETAITNGEHLIKARAVTTAPLPIKSDSIAASIQARTRALSPIKQNVSNEKIDPNAQAFLNGLKALQENKKASPPLPSIHSTLQLKNYSINKEKSSPPSSPIEKEKVSFNNSPKEKESAFSKMKSSLHLLKRSSSDEEKEITFERKESLDQKQNLSSALNKTDENLPEYLKVYDEFIHTESVFNDRLKTLLNCKVSWEKDPKNEGFFNFINEKKGKDKDLTASRFGLKKEGLDVINELFNQVSLVKQYSDILLEFFSKSSTFESKTKVFAGLKFDNFKSVTKAYKQYNHFQERLRKSEKKKIFEKLDNLLPLEEKRATQLNFEGFAAVLMQRLPRYKLLISALLEKARQDPNLEQEIKNLEIALKNVEKAAHEANEALKKSMRSTKYEDQISSTNPS